MGKVAEQAPAPDGATPAPAAAGRSRTSASPVAWAVPTAPRRSSAAPRPPAPAARLDAPPGRALRGAGAGRGGRGREQRRGSARAAPARGRDRELRAGRRAAGPPAGGGLIDLQPPDRRRGRRLDASGPVEPPVLSTRIRLARNLAGHVFQGRTSETEREEILDTVERRGPGSVLLRRATRFRLDRWTGSTGSCCTSGTWSARSLRVWRPTGGCDRGLAVSRTGIGVMMNEEDHLRIQGLHSGFALGEAYAEVVRVDAELGQPSAVCVSRGVRLPDRMPDQHGDRACVRRY